MESGEEGILEDNMTEKSSDEAREEKKEVAGAIREAATRVFKTVQNNLSQNSDPKELLGSLKKELAALKAGKGADFDGIYEKASVELKEKLQVIQSQNAHPVAQTSESDSEDFEKEMKFLLVRLDTLASRRIKQLETQIALKTETPPELPNSTVVNSEQAGNLGEQINEVRNFIKNNDLELTERGAEFKTLYTEFEGLVETLNKPHMFSNLNKNQSYRNEKLITADQHNVFMSDYQTGKNRLNKKAEELKEINQSTEQELSFNTLADFVKELEDFVEERGNYVATTKEYFDNELANHKESVRGKGEGVDVDETYSPEDLDSNLQDLEIGAKDTADQNLKIQNELESFRLKQTKREGELHQIIKQKNTDIANLGFWSRFTGKLGKLKRERDAAQTELYAQASTKRKFEKRIISNERKMSNYNLKKTLLTENQTRFVKRNLQEEKSKELKGNIKGKSGLKRFEARKDYQKSVLERKLDEKSSREERMNLIRTEYNGRWGKYLQLGKEKIKSKEWWADTGFKIGIAGLGVGLGVVLSPYIAAAGVGTVVGTTASLVAGGAKGFLLEKSKQKVRNWRGLGAGNDVEKVDDRRHELQAVLIGALSLSVGSYFSDDIKSAIGKLSKWIGIGGASATSNPASLLVGEPLPPPVASPVPAQAEVTPPPPVLVSDPGGISAIPTYEIFENRGSVQVIDKILNIPIIHESIDLITNKLNLPKLNESQIRWIAENMSENLKEIKDKSFVREVGGILGSTRMGSVKAVFESIPNGNLSTDQIGRFAKVIFDKLNLEDAVAKAANK